MGSEMCIRDSSTDQQRNLLAKANLLQPSSAKTPEHKAHDLAKFFLWDADFQTYNEERMTAHDPNAHKWSTGKENDWCRYCLWPRCQGWNGWRRSSEAERNKMYDMWYLKYFPKSFPTCPQETEWIYAKLRPLHIQLRVPTFGNLFPVLFDAPWLL